jgi:hypothetical protein
VFIPHHPKDLPLEDLQPPHPKILPQLPFIWIQEFVKALSPLKLKMRLHRRTMADTKRRPPPTLESEARLYRFLSDWLTFQVKE